MRAGFFAVAVIRFADFEFDPTNAVLRRDGTSVKLRPQALRILSLLVATPGQLVTRDRIRREVWGDDTFVDFNQGLNVCIRQIREALGDDPETPRFIETVPKLGYRFVAPVTEDLFGVGEAAPDVPLPPARRLFGLAAAAGIAMVTVSVAAIIWYWQPSAGADPSPIRALAVLPLVNDSGPDQEYFADGMTDALITDLAQIQALKVISRTSVMAYKQQRKPLPDIGRELDVDAVVEGSVRRSGDRVRVDVRLVRAATDHHLWAQTFERSLGDILTLQRDIARAVAVAVRASLTPEERSRLAETRSIDPAAYEAYSKARYYRAMDDPTVLIKAREFYEEAIRLDREFAQAYVGLAELFIVFGVNGSVPQDVAFPQARIAAELALRIDDRLGEPYITLAAVRSGYDWDWSGAETYFTRALERAPNYAHGRAWYAEYLMVRLRNDEAIAQLRRAQQLDPLSVVIRRTVGLALAFARDYDELLRHCRATLELLPNAIEEYRFISMANLARGEVKEALENAHRSTAGPGRIRGLIWLAYVNAVAGRREEAEQILSELTANTSDPPLPDYSLAALHGALGRRERALDLLERARAARYTWIQRVQLDPMFDPLRSDPRFEAFRRRIAQEDGIRLND